MSGENEVEYPTETMTTLANTKQTKWDADATEGVRKLRDALADRSTFGDLPVLASYGSVFEEVRTIYLETVRGAKADLEAVAQGIRTSAQQMKDRDDQAGAAFVELWQRWQNGPLESTARSCEGKRLLCMSWRKCPGMASWTVSSASMLLLYSR